MKYPNSRGLIVRKTYPELLSNHIRMFFQEYPGTRQLYNKAEKTIYWPNGSTTELSYLQNTDDVYTYQGREYDDISVDEVTQHEYEVIKILRSSLRTTNKELSPRMFLTGNPGGIGHADIKRIFIDREFNPDERPEDYYFVQSFVTDNQAIMDNDPEYVQRLKDLPEHLRKAYLEGDWNIFSGQVFSEFSHFRHVMKPIIPSPSFDHYLSFDWGYSEKSMFAAYLSAVIKMKTEDGQNFQRILTYKEWAGNMKSPHEWAKIIYEDCAGLGIKPYRGIGDSAMFNTQTDGSKAIAELMKDKWRELNNDHWIPMEPGTKNRIGRVATVHNWLSIGPDELPYWLITENCKYLIKTLPQLIYDDVKVDDVDCFIAGTKIKTKNGLKNIEEIKAGDFIWTPIGYRKAYIVGDPKKTRVTKVELSDGRILEGTSYHKVMVKGKGLVELQDLNCNDILMEWNTKEVRNIHQLFIMALSIENITVEGIMSQMERLYLKGILYFIVKYGLILMAPFLLGFTFIIKIIIRVIMIFPILNLWRKEDMRYYTTERELDQENYQIGSNNGDQVLGVKKRSVRMLIKCLRELLLGNFRVLIVAALLRRDIKRRYIAKNIHILKGLQNLFVKYVVVSSGKIKGKKQVKPVLINVVGNSGEKEVYRLRVSQAHLYSANGFIVTNTTGPDHAYDSISYFLARVPFISVKKGPLNYHASAIPKKVEWKQTEENGPYEQVPFTVDDFASQYK